MLTRYEARRQIEEATGCEVDHILIAHTNEVNPYSGLTSSKRILLSDHYMSAVGVELGYTCKGIDNVTIFDEPRLWGEEALSLCDRLEVSKNDSQSKPE